MCEQTEVHYLEGDVVWVKLGACWWPGRVRDVEKLPDDILESFRKKPIAAVQFFNEDKYEYVKNLDQICRYNCRRKNDFIKKGLDMYRAKQREGSSFMDKFPNDVAKAEELTGGNPEIIADNSFAPEEKPSYRGIFGGEKKLEKKGKMGTGSPAKSSPWKTKIASPSSPTSSVSSPRRSITHPRIIRMLKGEEEQHDVRIRQQPITPQRQTSPQNEPYKCYKCDFTSKRLNVVILHSKSHSSESATNGQELKQHNRSKSLGVERKTTPHRGRGRPRGSHSGSVGRPPKNSPKTQPTDPINSLESSTPKKPVVDLNVKESSEENVPTNEKKSQKSTLFGKRKGSKSSGEKTVKKKKSTEDFKEKLLADWGDEDPEEEEKEMMILKQELSKSGGLQSPTSEGTMEDNHSTKTVKKPKEISCFDFDENADSLLDHEFEVRAKKFAEARKFPRRLDDKIDFERKSETIEMSVDDGIKSKETSSRTVKSKASSVENKDIQEQFETIMAETELPSLPLVPDTTVKIPEKDVAIEEIKDEKTEVIESNFPTPEEINENSEITSEECVETLSKDTVECHDQRDLPPCPLADVPDEPSVDMPVKSETECLSEMISDTQVLTGPEPSVEHSTETPVDFVAETAVEEPVPTFIVDKGIDPPPELQNTLPEQTESISQPVPVSESQTDNSPEPSQTSLPQDSPQLSLAEEPPQTSVVQPSVHVALAHDATHLTLTHEPSPITIVSEPVQMLSHNSAQMSLEEMDLDINSMPVVMGDTLLPDDATKFNMSTVLPTNSVAITLPPAPVAEKPVIQQIVRKTIASTASPGSTLSPGTVTLNVTPTSEFVTEASTSVVKSSAQTTSANSTPKILKQVVKSVKIQPGTSGTLKTSDGSILTAKGATGASRYVVIQHSSGKKTIYATSGGKPGQQCVTVKTAASQGQVSQQTVGKKLVIVKSPTGGTVSQDVLSSLQGLSSGGKIVPQRIITSQGTILKQVGRSTPKVMHVTPQQMKALTGGKQVGGTKLTMQSTPTKVVLPTVTKLVSQTQGVKVVTSATTAKSKSNTILIQTTQGTNVGSTVVTRALSGTITVPTSAVQTKLTAVPQGMMRQVVGTTRPKLVASASSSGTTVQRVVVSTAGRGSVQLQGQQQKVLAARSGVQPRMLVQKAKGATAVRVPNVGAIAGVQSQVTQIQPVKKVQSVLPRAQILQKGKHSQVVQKVVTVQQQPTVSSVKATSSTEAVQTLALPSLQPLQSEVSIAPTIPQTFQSNTLVLSQAPSVINQSLTSQNAAIATTSAPLMSHEHIAQVITPAGSEQLGEGGTATYVLVTIDEQGTLQPYDSSNLMTTYDGNNQNTENNTRTLYIDPSSLGTSGDLENIFLAINNSAPAGGTGTLLNLGQTSAVSGANISTAQHSQSVFNIADSQPTASSGSQDILAAALANTDVFQPDGSMSDSLTVVNSSQSASGSVMTSRLLESTSLLPSSSSTTLHQTTVLLPSLAAPAMPPANTAGVLETSLTLNQPIMTPLEVPSSVTNLQQPPPPIPTSLELPLTITQPGLSIPSSQFSDLSQENSMPSQDSEVIESPISSSSVSQITSQTVISSRPTLQPSMPLLSEDVSDSQTTVTLETPAHPDLVDSQPENVFESAQTTNGAESESGIVSNTSHSEETTLPTYAQVPEVSSHATEEQGSVVNDISFESNSAHEQPLTEQGLSPSYQEVPESTSEASASMVQAIPEANETQSASEQTVSTSYARGLQETPPKERTDMIDSSNPPLTENSVPNYSIENSSEAVAVKEVTCVQEATATDETCVPYEQVESTSHLQETVEEVTEIEHTLPSESNTLQSYAPPPESTSSVSGEVLESNPSGTFSLPSYSQTPESTCELQEEKEVVPNQSASANYSQVPESTSHIVETGMTEDSPMDVLDSSQHSLDSSVLTPYQVPESSSEASIVSYEDTHGATGANPPSSNQTGYASCSQVPESTSHMQDVLTFSDSSTEVSDCAVPLPQSMPLLLDTGPGAIASKRPLEGEEHNANDLDHSKRVKIDETERIKDQVLSSSCPHPSPDSLSLQSGGERVPIDDDDDDLPSPCYPPSTLNQKIFARDDIVWMKINKLYIPGVVIRADKKQRTAKVKCINSPRKEKAFSKRFCDLLDFNNHSRNQHLLEESRKINPKVQDAFDKITEYWCMNCVAEKPISAARYLTYLENDKQYGITLLSGSNQVEQEDTWDDTDLENEEEEDDDDDDEAVQEEMQQESQQLFQIIESSECAAHLKSIFGGLVPSKRHTLFMMKKNIIQRNLIQDSGLGPFDEEMGMRMVSLLDSVLRKIDDSDIISKCGSRKDYLFHVFVPEAIIFALSRYHDMSFSDAEKRFKTLSMKRI